MNKKQMQWWKMLGQPVCSLLHKMSKFQRSPFCICFSWDKADASLTSFPTLVTAAKCQHPDTLHVLTTAFPISSTHGEETSFLTKTRNLSLQKLLFFPSFGAKQLHPIPAAQGDVAEPERRLSDPDDVPYKSFCNYLKQTWFSLPLTK